MTSCSIRCWRNDRAAESESAQRLSRQLGYLTDQLGRVHLGALLAPVGSEPPVYLDLLSPVGAADVATLNLEQVTVIVRGQDLAELRRIVERSVTDARLRDRLHELIAWSSGSF